MLPITVKKKLAKIGLPFTCEWCTSTQPHVKSDAYMCRECYVLCKYRPPVTTLWWSAGGLLQSKLSAFPIYLMHPHFSVIVSIFPTFISNSLYRYYRTYVLYLLLIWSRPENAWHIYQWTLRNQQPITYQYSLVPRHLLSLSWSVTSNITFVFRDACYFRMPWYRISLLMLRST